MGLSSGPTKTTATTDAEMARPPANKKGHHQQQRQRREQQQQHQQQQQQQLQQQQQQQKSSSIDCPPISLDAKNGQSVVSNGSGEVGGEVDGAEVFGGGGGGGPTGGSVKQKVSQQQQQQPNVNNIERYFAPQSPPTTDVVSDDEAGDGIVTKGINSNSNGSNGDSGIGEDGDCNSNTSDNSTNHNVGSSSNNNNNQNIGNNTNNSHNVGSNNNTNNHNVGSNNNNNQNVDNNNHNVDNNSKEDVDDDDESEQKPQKENVPTDNNDAMPKSQPKAAVAARKGRAVTTTATSRQPPRRRRTPKSRRPNGLSRGQPKQQPAGDRPATDHDSKDVKRITDYFQLRRSHRRTKGEVIKCKLMQMEEKVLQADETGFQVVKFEDKGRGVVSNVDLKAGDYVLEYAGDLIDLKEARRREEMYVGDTTVGCYMYYFQHENASHCIDATRESDRLGRLINHSIRSANLKTKSVTIGGVPRLVFLAKRDIASGEELLYDYGDRSKDSLRNHPWLKN